MGEVSSFFGRFHPLLVHFPIGILWLAFLLELSSRTKKYKKLKFATQPTLFIGAITSIGSAITGFWLSHEGGYDERLLQNHQWMGIITSLFSVLTYAVHRWTFLFKEKKQKLIRLILFIPLLILLTLTGHYGGSLTHGDGFLNSPSATKMDAKPVSLSSDSNFYNNVIAPVLEKKCYSCHSSKKQKGQLRLDAVEYILKGGKHGNLLKPLLPNASELYKRLVMPLADDHHMPPKDRDQLSNAETNLIYSWIEGGASFNKTIREMDDKNVIEYISTINESETDLDDSSLPELNQKEIAFLRAKDIIIMPLSKKTKFSKVFFINPKSITDKEVDLLKKFKKNLTDIKLTRTVITDKALLALSDFENLRFLELDYTSVSDQSLLQLKTLKKLTRLNLVATTISDKGIDALTKLPLLTEVYAFNTKVTQLGVAKLKVAFPKININITNYSLASLKTDTLVYKRK